jgi:adenylate cyclase
MAIADFAVKLALVLKRLNLSRARLAQTIGVDKSVVTRWGSGTQLPSDHNLALLTEAVARHRPGFERRDWDLDPSALATKFDDLDARAALRLSLPDRLSIAVLPFQTQSGDPEQEYLADGITEDITTELSRFHSLFVLAHHSSSSDKGQPLDIRRVGGELGVRYVLEGSLRKSVDRIRVTARLSDILSGDQLWAERYDRLLEDVFAVQEEVAQAIVGTIAPRMEASERSQVVRRRRDSPSAYETALRAHAHAWEGQDKADKSLLDLALREAREALAIDPDSVRALHALAIAHQVSLGLYLAADRKRSLEEAKWACARAIELDDSNALGYGLRGMAVWTGGETHRLPEALADVRRAHSINPNDTIVLSYLAVLEAAAGGHEHSIEHCHQVLRLNARPVRSHITYNLLGTGYFGVRRYADGVSWNLRSLNDMPRWVGAYRSLSVCLVGAGEIARAKRAFADGQRLSPAFFRMGLEGHSPFALPQDRQRFQTFLRVAAGLDDPVVADPLR